VRLIIVLLAASASISTGCSRDVGRQAASDQATHSTNSAGSSAASSPVPNGVLTLGEPINARVVALSEIAKRPLHYENQLVATTGKVTAVCQEMGCWMEIQDQTGLAHVRMHGHAFFVPKTAAGHVARVQATVLRASDEHCEDSPPPSHTMARVELDATGIELD
jgi:hypothetical protein